MLYSKYYIGQTGNLEKRLADHNLGLCGSTKKWIPWQLVYNEAFSFRGDAMKIEKQIKSYKGGEGFRKLVEGGGK